MVIDRDAPGLPPHGAGFHTDRTRGLWLPAHLFGVLSGVPDLALRNSLYFAYALDKDATEVIVGSFAVPYDYASGLVINLVHTNLGAGSGDVVWRVGLNNQGDGGTWSSLTTTDMTVTAPSQNVLKYSASAATLPNAAAAGQDVLLSCGRIATSGSDTLGNDAGFLGYLITYTADM